MTNKSWCGGESLATVCLIIMDVNIRNDSELADTSDDQNKQPEDEVENEEDGGEASVDKIVKKAQKKVIRHPRAKFDVDRLIGPKGLVEICDLLKTENFKEKGHEFENLDKMMHIFEYWAHRLVPHMPFDDFIEKAENLGTKKPVKSALRDLREKLHEKPDNNINILLNMVPSEYAVDTEILIDNDNDGNMNDNTMPIRNNSVPDDDELDELLR